MSTRPSKPDFQCVLVVKKENVMKSVKIGILTGIIIFIISFFLFNRMESANLTYSIIVSLNFGIFLGISTHSILINKLKQSGDIVAGIYTGLITAIILFAVLFGVELCGEFSATELLKLKFLVISTGYMSLSYGFLFKYIEKRKN